MTYWLVMLYRTKDSIPILFSIIKKNRKLRYIIVVMIPLVLLIFFFLFKHIEIFYINSSGGQFY